MASFESGVKMLLGLLKGRGPEAYYASEADPLHAAFAAKATVHSGPMGVPMLWGLARRKVRTLADEPRTARTLAYIHVPFCESRCLYCMFYQNPFSAEVSRHYVDLLIKELHMWDGRRVLEGPAIEAVYFGGGTPSALAASDIRRLVTEVRKVLPLAPDCEITLEGRVHSMTPDKVEAAIEAGVNRMSLGVQTFNTAVRQSLLRIEDREAVLRRLDEIASTDAVALVVDLIHGLPGQSAGIWLNDLETVTASPVDGFDCYQLNVFEKSPMAKRIAAGKLAPAGTIAECADRFATAVAFMTGKPEWTRVSNVHWRRGIRERNIYNDMGKGSCNCLPFGCGAGGKLAEHMFMLQRDLKKWESMVESGEKPVWALMKPTANWSLLRELARSVEHGPFDPDAIGAPFGVALEPIIAPVVRQWIRAGLLEREGSVLKPTVAGQFWHVTMSQFLVNTVAQGLNGKSNESTSGFGEPPAR